MIITEILGSKNSIGVVTALPNMYIIAIKKDGLIQNNLNLYMNLNYLYKWYCIHSVEGKLIKC